MNQDLIDRLRAAVQDIRRKPYPISDLIPLLVSAADALQKTEPGQPEVQVLPYMGPPGPSKRELAKQNYKAPKVFTSGTFVSRPSIEKERDDYER